MYTQLMSKDANRIYGLLYSLENVQATENREEINGQITLLKRV